MNRAHNLPPVLKGGVLLAAALGCLAFAGCGTPGAPQPPSLRLPKPIEDLSATRAAETVTLHWTTPQKTTDRLLIQGLMTATVCRQESAQTCQIVRKLQLTPGAVGDFQEILPAGLTSGAAHPVTYFVELSNMKGRSAGTSNPAVILAGSAPSAITGLTAETRADGVALHWQAGETTAVRLHRQLLNAKAPAKKPAESLGTPPAEPPFRDLVVESVESRTPGALDSSVHFGQSYEYTAQRILRLTVAGKTLELPGEISVPVRVDVIDTFPPAIPQGLVAILVPEEKTIDLSWQPDSEADLAGYIVYRSESDSTNWQRISGPQPVASPAYRDAAIAPGHSYHYAVAAIDQTGHESQRSPSAGESVPTP